MGILFLQDKKVQLYILDSTLREAERTDFLTLKSEIENKVYNIESLNEFIGFMSVFKSDYIIFKVKDLNKKRNKGARCDQMSKKHIIPFLNKIIENSDINKYTNDNIVQTGSKKKIGSLQLCCELELIFETF